MEHHNCIAEAIRAINWIAISMGVVFSVVAFCFFKALGGGWEKK